MKYYAVIDTNVVVSSTLKHYPIRNYVVTPKQMIDIISSKEL